MQKLVIVLSILILTTGQMVIADSGSAESAAGSLTSNPPSAPTLDSPSDGATGVMSSNVTWNTTLHAATYNLQVSTVSNFSSTITDESGLTEITYTVSGLSGGIQYFWHVSATNVSGTSDYSGTWDFTTDPSLPVTLSSFSAEPVNTGVLIEWTTESETDNLGFILERSTSLEDHPVWQVIASHRTHDELSGQGNTSVRTDYAFTDVTAEPGSTYQYRLSDVDTNGKVHIYDIIQIALPGAPEMTTLDPPFPNPFNPQTKIMYHLSNAGHVEINVFDLMGRKVKTLFNEYQSAGSYTLYWHGQDNTGNQMASGAYLIMLKTAEEVKNQKVILLQ